MGINREFLNMAKRDVSILEVLNFIQEDLHIDFNIQEGQTFNLRCPSEVLDRTNSVHSSASTLKTTFNLNINTIKCWNPACTVNHGLDTIGLIQMFYPDLSFEAAIKQILSIGGINYVQDVNNEDIDEEKKLKLLLTRYINECSLQLLNGYSILESGRMPKGRIERLCVDAASYLVGRGITKKVVRLMKLGIGGNPSKVIQTTSKELLKKAKILSDKKGFELMTKRITIPNISNGLVVGITGRDIYDGDRRYLNVGQVKNLINIDKAKKYNKIFIFEGALNGAAYSVITGQENFIAMQGAESFKSDYVQDIINSNILLDSTTEFIYVCDYDTAGLKAASDLGVSLSQMGFSFNVIVTPRDSTEKKIDLNDILVMYKPEKALEIWENLLKKTEHFVVFAIKRETLALKKDNELTYNMQKCKIIEKYLSYNFLSPLERWTIQQYLYTIGYPVVTEFAKYLELKFSKEPILIGNKLVCFVNEIQDKLKEDLTNEDIKFNIISLELNIKLFEISSDVEIVLLTSPKDLIKTRVLGRKFLEKGNTVRVFCMKKPITSIIEYTFAINKAIEIGDFFNKYTI